MASVESKKAKVSMLKRIRSNIKHGTVLESIRCKLEKIGIEISPEHLFQEGIDYAEITKIKGADNDYSIAFLGMEDMKVIGADEWGFSEEKSLELLNKGHKCLAIRHINEIAAFMWINFSDLHVSAVTLNLKDNEANLWAMYTKEAYRGLNLAPYLRYKSYEILKEMGRNVLYSVSVSTNTPALRFKEKLGARKLKIMLYIQLFKKFHWSFTLKTYKAGLK